MPISTKDGSAVEWTQSDASSGNPDQVGGLRLGMRTYVRKPGEPWRLVNLAAGRTLHRVFSVITDAENADAAIAALCESESDLDTTPKTTTMEYRGRLVRIAHDDKAEMLRRARSCRLLQSAIDHAREIKERDAKRD